VRTSARTLAFVTVALFGCTSCSPAPPPARFVTRFTASEVDRDAVLQDERDLLSTLADLHCPDSSSSPSAIRIRIDAGCRWPGQFADLADRPPEDSRGGPRACWVLPDSNRGVSSPVSRAMLQAFEHASQVEASVVDGLHPRCAWRFVTAEEPAVAGEAVELAFSPVLFDEERRLALVFVSSHNVGGFCGRGVLWALERTPEGWRMQAGFLLSFA
jgi:hypothetical protein